MLRRTGYAGGSSLLFQCTTRMPETMKTNASSTRMVIRRINDNIDNLPVKALETFNEAIQAYLNKDQEPEAATE